jgi:hypothetical protein
VGANFVASYIFTRIGSSINFGKAREKILSLSKIHLSRWGETLPGYLDASNFYDLPMELDGSKDDTAERHEACNTLLKVVDEVEKGWTGDLRDTGTITLGGFEVLLSAGMTWGDPPTESCRTIDIFSMTGLQREAGFE